MKSIICISLLLFACEKQESPVDDELTGTYINREYSDSIITFQRAIIIPENTYAIKFNPNGSLVERKNSGWCGTPPIAYGNFEGSWTRNDEFVEYTVDFWGGTMDIKWEIIAFDKQKLIVKEIDRQTHMTE